MDGKYLHIYTEELPESWEYEISQEESLNVKVKLGLRFLNLQRLGRMRTQKKLGQREAQAPRPFGHRRECESFKSRKHKCAKTGLLGHHPSQAAKEQLRAGDQKAQEQLVFRS